MRLTTRTYLAISTLMYCAANEGRTIRTSEVAEATEASENHLGQVINLLGRTGFIDTIRGRGGGIRLARMPEEITVGHVFRVFEAPVPFSECFNADDRKNPGSADARLKYVLGSALDAFYETLDAITLATLTERGDKTLRSAEFEAT